MIFEKAKTDMLQALKTYEDYEGCNNLAGLCSFIKWACFDANRYHNNVMYDMYGNLGIITLDYDNKIKIGSGKNWLRIAVAKLLIEVLEDPSVFIANKAVKSDFDYDLYSSSASGEEKIQKLKDFIKQHQS